jgi:hypothetical protein
MIFLKSALAGVVTAAIVAPLFAFGYVRWINRGHSGGLLAVADGRNELLAVLLVSFIIGAVLTYFRLR